jgi:DNA-binding PadR family transcriptional regulator
MYIEIVILALLRQRPQHGYELKKSITVALGGAVSLNNKVLYPALNKFEALGAVERHVVPQEGKPNRHIYHLTDRGIELLHTRLRDFGSEQAGSDTEFFTRVAFFDYLDVNERRDILHTRLAYLGKGLAYLETLQQLADEACPQVKAQQRVLAFHFQQMGNERQWIETWLEELPAQTS